MVSECHRPSWKETHLTTTTTDSDSDDDPPPPPLLGVVQQALQDARASHQKSLLAWKKERRALYAAAERHRVACVTMQLEKEETEAALRLALSQAEHVAAEAKQSLQLARQQVARAEVQESVWRAAVDEGERVQAALQQTVERQEGELQHASERLTTLEEVATTAAALRLRVEGQEAQLTSMEAAREREAEVFHTALMQQQQLQSEAVRGWKAKVGKWKEKWLAVRCQRDALRRGGGEGEEEEGEWRRQLEIDLEKEKRMAAKMKKKKETSAAESLPAAPDPAPRASSSSSSSASSVPSSWDGQTPSPQGTTHAAPQRHVRGDHHPHEEAEEEEDRSPIEGEGDVASGIPFSLRPSPSPRHAEKDGEGGVRTRKRSPKRGVRREAVEEEQKKNSNKTIPGRSTITSPATTIGKGKCLATRHVVRDPLLSPNGGLTAMGTTTTLDAVALLRETTAILSKVSGSIHRSTQFTTPLNR